MKVDLVLNVGKGRGKKCYKEMGVKEGMSRMKKELGGEYRWWEVVR